MAIVKLLLEKGANIAIKNRVSGVMVTAEHVIFNAFCESHEACNSFLLS